tara:strand:+ start:141 stop:536 length:396 start_codon:yes stop_codon:yes gene_type:complete
LRRYLIPQLEKAKVVEAEEGEGEVEGEEEEEEERDVEEEDEEDEEDGEEGERVLPKAQVRRGKRVKRAPSRGKKEVDHLFPAHQRGKEVLTLPKVMTKMTMIMLIVRKTPLIVMAMMVVMIMLLMVCPLLI